MNHNYIMNYTCTNKGNIQMIKLFHALNIYIIFGLFFSNMAFAYVDPGSGSVIVTTIIGLIAAIGYTCRKYFYKIKRMILGNKAEQAEKAEHQEND